MLLSFSIISCASHREKFILQNYLSSVREVQISDGSSYVEQTGFIINEKENEYYLVTAAHGWREVENGQPSIKIKRKKVENFLEDGTDVSYFIMEDVQILPDRYYVNDEEDYAILVFKKEMIEQNLLIFSLPKKKPKDILFTDVYVAHCSNYDVPSVSKGFVSSIGVGLENDSKFFEVTGMYAGKKSSGSPIFYIQDGRCYAISMLLHGNVDREGIYGPLLANIVSRIENIKNWVQSKN